MWSMPVTRAWSAAWTPTAAGPMPARWALIAVVAACAVLAACFLTEPKPAEPALPEGLSLSEYRNTKATCG